MGDQPVTKKDIAALQKQIDELSKFKKWAEDTFAERKKWFDDEKKVVHQQLDNHREVIDNHANVIVQLSKG